MKRNVMREWTRALSHVSPERVRAWAQVFAQPHRDFVVFDAHVAKQDSRDLLRSTRTLLAGGTAYAQQQDDLARAILILQRNNKLLRARFGVDWAGAASVLLGEAARRGMSVSSLARVLSAGLRRDARSAGESGGQ